MGEPDSRVFHAVGGASTDEVLEPQDIELEECLQGSQPLHLADMLLLTCPSLGLQVCWFLLTSSGTPYLLSLGISKSIISLVWVTGPIFGAFAQPILGVLSDESRHSWGKRKPFIVVGAACAAVFLLILAYSRDLASWTWEHPSLRQPTGASGWQTKTLAVFCVVVVTFALQAYQVGLRALMVDVGPPSQQPAAASWAMRWNVLGNVMLSSVGFVDAQWSLTGADGGARFKILAVVVAACCATTVGLMCYYIPDKNTKLARGYQLPFMELFWSIISPRGLSARWSQLPPRSRRVCEIQFYAWAGWFPVLYYMSTFAYETALSDKIRHREWETWTPDRVLAESARNYAFFASFAFALGAFAGSISLQVLDRTKPAVTRKLPQIWLASQCFLGCCMCLTFVARTGLTAIIIVALMGVTGAVTMWTPFALISAEICELSTCNTDMEVAWILGLHNMAISLPQIGSGLVCAFLLAGFQVLDVEDSVAWVFRLASVPVFWSSYLIHKSC